MTYGVTVAKIIKYQKSYRSAPIVDVRNALSFYTDNYHIQNELPNERDIISSSYEVYRQPSTTNRVTWKSNFLCHAITHPCPNFNDGLTKPPLTLGHVWELFSKEKKSWVRGYDYLSMQ